MHTSVRAYSQASSVIIGGLFQLCLNTLSEHSLRACGLDVNVNYVKGNYIFTMLHIARNLYALTCFKVQQLALWSSVPYSDLKVIVISILNKQCSLRWSGKQGDRREYLERLFQTEFSQRLGLAENHSIFSMCIRTMYYFLWAYYQQIIMSLVHIFRRVW
jgi:hypothetical protein